MKALIGTPSGSSQAGSMEGHCEAGAVNRAFGCAAFRPDLGVHGWPCQSMSSAGGSGVIPSHHTSPSGVRATLVKIVLDLIVAIAWGFDFSEVPGATPKNPASGLIACSRPSGPGRIHAMSSPTVVTVHPSHPLGGNSMARLVLPQALGNPAAT